MSPAPGRSGRAHRLQAARRLEHGLAEMVGLVRGIVADGALTEQEAARLSEWARANPEIAMRWPANLLAARLERIFRDGRLDAEERTRLRALLEQVSENPGGLGGGFHLATDLPLTRPAPEVVFAGRTFVFAGEMAYGPVQACEREVVELGGFCERSVNRRTDYLVIGELAADDWSQESFGPLVDDVVLQRSRGARIAIVSEERWAAALP